MTAPLLFKVLVDNKPCHGGSGEYPPIGKWTEPVSDLRLCVTGYHLTADPLKWWRPNARLFVAEPDGLPVGDGRDKAVFRRVRLVEEVTKDWPWLIVQPRVRAFLAACGAIERANLSRANLSDANLSDADLSGANLSDANLSDADLSRANLSHAYLSDANLSRADLSDANLSRANLSHANLSDAYLSGANLSGANLSDADLSGAYLSRADLSGADLSDANLSDANLSDAYLSGANLSDANLSDADLSGANLSRAYRPIDPPAGWKPNDSGRLVREGGAA